MQFTAAQIALFINASIEGDPEASISDISKIEEGREGTLSFIANPKYEHYLYTTQSSVIIVNNSLQLEQPVKATLLRVADAYSAFATLLEKYNEYISLNNQHTGIEQPSFIHETATVGQGVYVGAFAYIGKNARIGDQVKIFPGAYIGNHVVVESGTVIHAGVKVYQDCRIGSHVIIHAGTVIGADGFGFAPQADGTYKKVPQLGNVIIEDHVEIGANTTIDRATIGATIIKKRRQAG